MALDNSLLIYSNAAFTASNAVNVQSSALTIGRMGLPRGGQFYTSLQTPSVSKTVAIDLLLSLDGNISNGRVIARHTYPGGYAGVRVTDIATDFNAQEYASANIVVGTNAYTPSANDANNTNCGLLKAYLSVGEARHSGRKPTADTLESP